MEEKPEPVSLSKHVVQALVELGARTDLGSALLTGYRGGLAQAEGGLPEDAPCRLEVQGTVWLVPQDPNQVPRPQE